MNFFSKLFDTKDFPARWHCGNWTSGHGWLHILSDIGVWSAYFAIPALLIFLVLRRKDIPFQKIFLLFGAFILLCGLTHLMEAIIFWWPAYRLAGVLKFLTAVVSWTTVVALVRVGPRALEMRSPEELEREIEARKKAEAILKDSNAELERRVAERTADLEASNAVLHAEREWFKTTLISIGDGVITTDADGSVHTMNSVAEKLTGWTEQDAATKPLSEVFEIINEHTREPVENPALRALEQGIIVGLANHTILIAKDGTELYIDDSAAPIKDQDGEIIGSVLIFRDISQRYQAEKEKLDLSARLNMLVQNAPLNISLFDTDLKYVELNQRIASITGLSIEAHLGQKVSELLPSLGPKIEEQLRQVRVTGEPVLNVELSGQVPATENEQRHWLANFFPLKDSREELLGIGSILLEITDRKRNLEALAYQYELTKTITENATTGIFMINQQGECTFMNPAAERIIGYRFADVKGKSLHGVIHHTRPDGTPYPLAECPFMQALAERSVVQEHEDYFIHEDGEFFPVICNTSIIYKNNEPTEAVIEVLDLTEQKLAAEKLTQSEREFILLADSIPQLAWIADPTGHINWFNTRWYEYTGTTFEEMQGWGWEKVHDPAVLPEVLEEWKDCLATGRPLDMVFPLQGANGEYRPFLTRVMPFRNKQGKIVRWFGTNTDISDQKETQEELRVLAARLSEADRRKNEFLATLAHELRNPLAPIRTGLEILKRAGDDRQIFNQTRETMERQTKLLITLIDDLLEITRITQGKLELKQAAIEVSDFVQTAVESSQPYIDEAGHELVTSLPKEAIQIYADPHRMAQVVSNLLNNAAKYTPQGGRIWLTAEREDNNLLLKVRDNGIGIPADMQDKIFEMFAQIERPMEKSYTGLGIGLTLVKSLLEMHGGQISVQSPGVDQGSEFQVRIPIMSESIRQQSELEESVATEASAVKHRVLVVDDNQAAADMLAMVIKIQGHEVHTAYDGEEAVRVAAEVQPQIVFMDIGMPNLNGYEAARKMRDEDWGKKIYLVALTGWGQDDDKRQSKEAGFDHHLVKPANPDEVERILREFVS